MSQDHEAPFPAHEKEATPAWNAPRDAVRDTWATLDPIFVLGMQRSGTSIVAMGLHAAGFRGFAEGHLWHELVATFDRLRDGEHLPELRLGAFAFGDGRDAAFSQYLALAIDRFHRHHVPDIHVAYDGSESQRWVDKTPGSEAVGLAPRLARMFPRAQFVFVHRDGAATVESGLRMWPDQPDIFHVMCRDWAKTQATWRQVRKELGERALEIAQADIASTPREVAERLTAFVGGGQYVDDVAELFAGRRENSSFPERAPRDYDLRLAWTEGQKARFHAVCGPEMAVWGYPPAFALDPWPLRIAGRAGELARQGGPLALLREGTSFVRWHRDRALHWLKTGQSL